MPQSPPLDLSYFSRLVWAHVPGSSEREKTLMCKHFQPYLYHAYQCAGGQSKPKAKFRVKAGRGGNTSCHLMKELCMQELEEFAAIFRIFHTLRI